MGRLARCLAVVAALGTVAVAVPAQAATTPLPVPYSFLTSAVAAGLTPNANAPGTNDWSCRPSAAHPEPVVLVHGLIGNRATNWQTYGPLLKNNGYCVFALTYGASPLEPKPYDQEFGGITDMRASAAEVGAFVDRVLAATGASKVDIVGHSEGTQVPDYWAKFLGGASKIDKYVSLAPIWHGTDLAGLGTLSRLGAVYGVTPVADALASTVFASGPQLLTGSDFYAQLRQGGTTQVPGIDYTNIVTKYDELVTPYHSGIEPGETNEIVQDYCSLDLSEHFEIVADPVAAVLVLNALDPAHPQHVPCRLVLPFVGTS